MPELQRLQADHAPAVLAFELANRAYFSAFISDRGDEFFDQFTERFGDLLAEQDAGTGAFYVLVAEDGSVLGRFNLYSIGDGTAELGYRVAQHVAGRGVATEAVRELCRLAAARHGVRTLRAGTSSQNFASQKVLTKAGFVPAGPADPAQLGGKPGIWFQRDLMVWETGRMSDPPDGLPVYRVLTGPDDAAFCHRVSEAVALGYRLHAGPALTFNGERVIVGQALVWPGAGDVPAG